MGSEELYALPLVFGRTSNALIDPDLSMTLVFWAVESSREKGGGIFRRKEPELVRQIAFLYRPILVSNYRGTQVAFDGCRIVSTKFRYGIAPSLTNLRSYLISDAWEAKPESYAGGLDLQSRDFELAHEQHTYAVPGWITDGQMLGELGDLLEQATPSQPRLDALPQLVTYESVKRSFEELDELKRLLSKEIGPLKGLELELNERTIEVLAPLKEEYARIEHSYDKRVNEIRPSVVANKRKLEDQRADRREQIQRPIDEQLHDLKGRLSDAKSKIAAYEYDETMPRGGIEKQYSLKDNLKARIKELEEERNSRIALLDEKYNRLVEEEQDRIDSLERAKQNDLKDPTAKIERVRGATNRLVNAIRGLAKNHESIVSLGINTNLVLPKQIGTIEFVAYLPVVLVEFEAESKNRTDVFSTSVMKDRQSFGDNLRGLVGMKKSPLERKDSILGLARLALSVVEDQKLSRIALVSAKRFNALRDPATQGLLTSGISKLQGLGWMKPKEAIEFHQSIQNYFVPSHSDSVETPETPMVQEDAVPMNSPSVRFVSHTGLETFVALGKLEELRKSDEEDFKKGVAGMKSAIGESVRLLRYLKSIRIPHNKKYCVDKKEDWVQNQLYLMLANSEFRARVHRERTFTVKEIEARIDFDVAGIGIEVKIFRSHQDFQRLATEMLHYTKEYSEILIPYINVEFSDDRLNSEFRFLTEQHKEIKGFFELNCSDIEH